VRNIGFTSIRGLKNGIAGVKEPMDFNNIVYIFFSLCLPVMSSTNLL
jgi:hypothetical protein